MIPSQLQTELARKSLLSKYAENSYFREKENKNFQYIKNKFFNGEADDKVQTLIVGSGVFSVIAGKVSKFVKSPIVKGGDPKFNINIPTENIAKDISSVGYGVIGIKITDEEISFVHIPAKTHFVNGMGKDCTVTIYEVEENKKKTYYSFVREFDIGITTNKLYLLKTASDLSSAKEVPLTTLTYTQSYLPIQNTGLSVPSIITVGYQQGKSLIEIVEDRVLSMDRKRNMFDTQFLQNVESFVIMKGIQSMKEESIAKQIKGKGSTPVNYAEIGRIIRSSDPQAGVEFANNVNPLLAQAKEDYIEELKYISSVTDIPVEFFGVETGDGAIGEGSRWIKHSAFISRIDDIRNLIDKGLSYYINKVSSLKGILYSWPDIIPTPENDRIDNIIKGKESDLISHKSAIMQYNGYTEEEAEEEYKIILSQNSVSGSSGEQ